MRVRTFMDIKPTKIACILAPQVRGKGVEKDVAHLWNRHVDIGLLCSLLQIPVSLSAQAIPLPCFSQTNPVAATQ